MARIAELLLKLYYFIAEVPNVGLLLAFLNSFLGFCLRCFFFFRIVP